MAIGPGSRGLQPTHTHPVRAFEGGERRRLDDAAAAGPFVAWRDSAGTLQVRQLTAGEALSVGRSQEQAIVLDHLMVSREHARVMMRTTPPPAGTTVHVIDLESRHGTEHRRIPIDESAHSAPKLRPVPRRPAGPLQLAQGDHDIRLAGEVWMRIGGVPIDPGKTGDPEHLVDPPRGRKLDVLVELCRAQFCSPDHLVAPPSNAEIALSLEPPIGAARVSDLLSELYKHYELNGTAGRTGWRWSRSRFHIGWSGQSITCERRHRG